jgi:Carboxypeptidase regulatory-like domain
MHHWFALICLLVVAELEPGIGRPSAQVSSIRSAGVIVGIVTNESGQPVVGARVQAIGRKKKWAGDYYEIPTGALDDSDDRGHFRLHSLPPGHYVVAVSIAAQPPPSDYREALEYVRTYHPSTTSLTAAQPVAVEPEKEHSAHVAIAPVRRVSVSGIATTSAGQPAAQFDVWLRGGPATVGYTGVKSGYLTAMVATSRVAQDGSFSLIRVPPGT